MRNFKELLIWQKSHELVLDIYKNTFDFPKEEMYGVTNQIRRAAVSVPTNIAEGCGRNSNPDLSRFITISSGSASEVEYLLLLSKDLNYLQKTKYDELNEELIQVKKNDVFIYAVIEIGFR